MKKVSLLIIGLLFFVSVNSFGQQKDIDKLKNLISKGKMEKAQEHCDKVTASLSEKRAARFHGYLARGYYKYKDYEKAAEAVLLSNDLKLAVKLANEFKGKDNELAGKLYSKGKKFNFAAALLFEAGKYKEAAKTGTSVDSNVVYGNRLFEKEQYDDALHFYLRAKRKGEKFNEQHVLDYYYNKKDYNTVYKIQNYLEGDFKMHIQGSVFDKMLEKKEPIPDIKKFLADLGIANNKQDEVIVNAYLNNSQYDEAEAYCLSLKKPYDQIALRFMAEKMVNTHPNASARANLLLGNEYIANSLLSDYLIKTAIESDDKWESEPIDEKLLESFRKETKPSVEKCKQKYCEFLSKTAKICTAKIDEFKTDAKKAKNYSRAAIFLKQAAKGCK